MICLTRFTWCIVLLDAISRLLYRHRLLCSLQAHCTRQGWVFLLWRTTIAISSTLNFADSLLKALLLRCSRSYSPVHCVADEHAVLFFNPTLLQFVGILMFFFLLLHCSQSAVNPTPKALRTLVQKSHVANKWMWLHYTLAMTHSPSQLYFEETTLSIHLWNPADVILKRTKLQLM